MVCPPCKLFSVLQRLRKSKGFEYEQALQGTTFVFCYGSVRNTMRGASFCLNMPWSAESWSEQCVKDILNLSDVCCVCVISACMFGLHDAETGKLPKKANRLDDKLS